MRRCVSKILAQNEKVLIDEKPHVFGKCTYGLHQQFLVSLFCLCVGCAYLLNGINPRAVVSLLIAALFALAILEVLSYNYVVTSKRVIVARGWLFINLKELLFSEIESVSYRHIYQVKVQRDQIVFCSNKGITLVFDYVNGVRGLLLKVRKIIGKKRKK